MRAERIKLFKSGSGGGDLMARVAGLICAPLNEKG